MKTAIIISGVCLIILTIVLISQSTTVEKDARGNLYTGSETCKSCHLEIFENYKNTAHYISATPANPNTVHGSFDVGENIFVVNDSQKVIMEKTGDSMFQSYYFKGKLKERHRFDIVFGGIKGESYLSWSDDNLYQMPLSYYTSDKKWSTSPGYGFDFLNYPHLRAIGKQCLECHVSYINNVTGEIKGFEKEEEFERNSLIYHIDCERCHGPGKKHVEFQQQNPEVKTAKYIVRYESLNKSQRLDMCAVCHSGRPMAKLRSSFEFVPGDTFAGFKLPELYHKVDTAHLDVHGNQLLLLQNSKCYKKSEIDCATCHNPHLKSRGNEIIFVQKCLNCHGQANHVSCSLSVKLTSAQMNANCINCHMPSLPTRTISVLVSDKQPSVQFFVHTHRIAIYPEEVKKVLAYINKQ